MELKLLCEGIMKIEECQKNHLMYSCRPHFETMNDDRYQEMQDYKKMVVKQMALSVGITPEDLGWRG